METLDIIFSLLNIVGLGFFLWWVYDTNKKIIDYDDRIDDLENILSIILEAAVEKQKRELNVSNSNAT